MGSASGGSRRELVFLHLVGDRHLAGFDLIIRGNWAWYVGGCQGCQCWSGWPGWTWFLGMPGVAWLTWFPGVVGFNVLVG